MAKVFTITEGLENLGALKTGGQGSVYKGRRTGEIITAIKLLPTPIHCEDENDKNYKSFQNEVKKLQRVNEEAHPNVVTILGSGITETGCLPFIEMEYIEGPDLGELLKPPHEPIFTVKEAIKVANHLSCALAHCHKCDIKHGDIKSNNVKYNKTTGNYMLLDFGLAVMSDEDRRTSLRHAGAIEFMAPEQNRGEVLFETDVYSFGVIIYELLAGRVPFPLQDSGETARNAVMVSHMETPPPDVLLLREENLPKSWDEETGEKEMQVPEWLVSMVYKCLEKNPEDRFDDGIELHDYVIHNSTMGASAVVTSVPTDDRAKKLKKENDELKKQLLVYQKAAEENEVKLRELRSVILQHEQDAMSTPINRAAAVAHTSKNNSVPKGAFYTILVIAAVLAGITFYSLVLRPGGNNSAVQSQILTDTTDTTGLMQSDIIEEQTTTIDDKRKKVKPTENMQTDSLLTGATPVEKPAPPKSTPPGDSSAKDVDTTSLSSSQNIPHD